MGEGNKKKRKTGDIIKFIYYSYNKKGNYAFNCTKP